MRSFVALGLPIAFAVVASAASAPAGNEWSYTPDKTADWYKQHGEPLPEVAQDVTTVEDGKSYIVKLECLGCAFRVRHGDGDLTGEPSSVPVDNSLLLNITVDDSYPAILLNGDLIVPFGRRPPNVKAFQVPTNTSADVMSKMVESHMLDASWKLGTKYTRYELQYEHTLLGTEKHNEEWVQFDVTGMHLRPPHGSQVYQQTQMRQKIVQFLFAQEKDADGKTTVSIKKIELVERKDRRAPILMKCGKPAMVMTDYNPLEWDYYGKIGTWSRTFAKTSSNTFNFIKGNASVLIVLVVLFSVYKFVLTWRIVVRRRAEAAMAKEQQDAELALLTSPDFDDEYDAPPDYDNVPAAETRKEDEQ